MVVFTSWPRLYLGLDPWKHTVLVQVHVTCAGLLVATSTISRGARAFSQPWISGAPLHHPTPSIPVARSSRCVRRLR